jgi:hypothetical protein
MIMNLRQTRVSAPWLSLLLGVGLWGFVGAAAQAQTAPTARYARGENVDLALIIREWKQKHPGIPVFACVCNQAICDATARWPFRNFSQYQFTVALGSFNADYNQSLGFNCFDIQTGQAPNAPDPGEPDPSPQVEVLDEGRQLRGQWFGSTQEIDITDWNVNVLDALDCSGPEIVDQREFNGQRVVGEPAINPETGNIAVGVLLTECVETQQTAIFVIDPQPGGYALYRVQVPGDRPLPNEFSTFPLSSLAGLQYWDRYLQVRHGDASGSEALLVFEPANTPAGEFGGCIELQQIEGRGLCPMTENGEP